MSSTTVGRVARAGAWGASASVLLGGSILLYQMLFTADGSLEEWVTSPLSSSVLPDANSDRPLTNADPDLPSKTDLFTPLGPSGLVESSPEASASLPGTADDSSGPESDEDSSEPSDDDSSGPGSVDDDDSSGHGSGGGDSSGPGSGDDDDDSSGRGPGGGDSSRHGSGGDGDRSA